MGAETQSRGQRAWVDAGAGAIAGCVARFAVGPLDVLKIRFQVQLEPHLRKGAAALPGQLPPKYTSMGQALRTIVREEGILGLWRGTLAGQLLYVPYTVVQFVTLQQVNLAARRLQLTETRAAPLISYASGAVAGMAATCISYPFDLLRTTLAAQGEPKVYQGLTAAARGIVAQHGVRGLYRGLGITMIEIVPYSALQFGLYDSLNAAYNRARRRGATPGGRRASENAKAGSLQHFLCGLIAGTVAKLGTHPLDVCKKRFQVAGFQRSQRYGANVTSELVKTLPGCLSNIWHTEGMRGLYKGALPSIMKSAPAAAVTFATYELCIRTLLEANTAASGLPSGSKGGDAGRSSRQAPSK